jgi:hypothetical protein
MSNNVWIEKLRLSTFENNGKLRLSMKNFIYYLRIKIYLQEKLHLGEPFEPLPVRPSWP